MALTQGAADSRLKVGEGVGGERLAVPKPLYSQVRDMLAREISGGQWTPGSVLPNESMLAQTYGVSIGTIRRAVEGLEEMGIVMRRQGRGTFISGLGSTVMSEKFSRLRMRPKSEVLSVARKTLEILRKPPSPAQLLAFGDAGGEVLELSQAVVHSGVTLGVEQHVLPSNPSLRLDDALASGRDIYQALAENGVMITRTEETLTAIGAVDGVAKLLEVTREHPLLQVDRRSFAIDDRLVEISVGLYDAARVCYVAI